MFTSIKLTYLVYKAVVLLGPWTIRFVNDPANVTAPWPLLIATLSICIGSNGLVPISGMPNLANFKFGLKGYINTYISVYLPLAKYGNIYWKVLRKHSSKFGSFFLHAFNQTAKEIKHNFRLKYYKMGAELLFFDILLLHGLWYCILNHVTH